MQVFIFLMTLFMIIGVNSKVYDIVSGLKKVLRDAFPANAFDSRCVGRSCPSLGSPNVCSTSGSSYDLSATISALTSCAKQSVICGIQLQPRTIPVLTFSLDQLLQAVGLTGRCNSTPACSFTNAIPTFDVISANKLTMNLPNLSLAGDISCQIGISSTFNAPAQLINFEYNFNYSSSILINNNEVEVSEDQCDVTGVSFMGLKFPSLPDQPDFFATFKTLVADVLRQMGLTAALDQFYRELLSDAFQIAKENCN